MNPALSAGDLCTREVVVAHRDLALTEAARLMREHHVGCLVIVDETAEGRQPVGLLTDRDIITAVVARNIDLGTLCTGDVMSSSPVAARESDSLLDALAAMRRAGARRVPVVDDRSLLQGLLALDDVIETIGEQMSMLVQVLAAARQREPQRRP
ncbi:MAG: CBS domain-containing protein [Leptothrix sp. (in: Bacteria)]|nr:CBS domain-containing protein [Leptothrix sp. (in: b-proteobacteria)]